MKTYKHLWEKFISPENFDLAAKKAIKGKKSKKQIAEFLANRTENLERLRQTVMRGEFKTSRYRIMTIHEPKERKIYVLPLYPDHIVHHALMNVLGPIWQRGFVRDSYACIPGRGLHAASRRMMHFIRKNKYVLQCDIKKFYPNMNHKILLDVVGRKIKDTKMMNILREIVCSVQGETNIPIGNLTSQWFGNVFLNELDHFVKEKIRWRAYVRYCDDFCLFGNVKRRLWRVARQLADFLQNKMALVFSKCAVRPVSMGISFVGYKHFPRFVLVRRRGFLRARHMVLKIARNRNLSDFSVAQLASVHGHLRWACTRRLIYRLRRELFFFGHF